MSNRKRFQGISCLPGVRVMVPDGEMGLRDGKRSARHPVMAWWVRWPGAGAGGLEGAPCAVSSRTPPPGPGGLAETNSLQELPARTTSPQQPAPDKCDSKCHLPGVPLGVATVPNLGAQLTCLRHQLNSSQRSQI